VVGDGEVVEAEVDGGRDEVLERDATVAGAVGVVVEVAAEVVAGDEVGQLPASARSSSPSSSRSSGGIHGRSSAA
jgi:hypothetical protein